MLIIEGNIIKITRGDNIYKKQNGTWSLVSVVTLEDTLTRQ